MQPCYGAWPDLATADRAGGGRCDIKHGGASYSGVTGWYLRWGGHIRRGRSGQGVKKCFAGCGVTIRTVCGISFLLPQSSADIPPDPICPASQVVTLTHSCYGVLWFRPHSAHQVLNSGSRHVQLPRLKRSLRTVRRRGTVSISGQPHQTHSVADCPAEGKGHRGLRTLSY